MALLGASQAGAATYSFDISATGFTCAYGPDCGMVSPPYPTVVEDFSVTLDPTQTYDRTSVGLDIIFSNLPYPLENFSYAPGYPIIVATISDVGSCTNPPSSACTIIYSPGTAFSSIFVQYSDASGNFWDTTLLPTQTPLQSTWLLLLSGLLGLGFFAYRGPKKNGAALSAA